MLYTVSSMAARQSSYRKSYQAEMSAPNAQYTISGEVKVMKTAEKEQLKTLNNSLVNYIDKVHELEQMVKKLSAANLRLCRKNKKVHPDIDIAAMFEAELKRLRLKVEKLQANNVEIAVERDNKTWESEEVSVKYVAVSQKTVTYEKEIEGLRADVDDATVERAKMEAKIESLMEQLVLERKVHEGEMENLRGQVQPVEAAPLFSEMEQKPSLLPDLSEAIANVRKEYEQFNAKSLEDLDCFYKEKVEVLNKQVKSCHIEIRELKTENVEKRREIQRIELELQSLRQKRITLEKTIEALEARLNDQDKLKEEELNAMRAQLDNTKQDLGKYLKQYQELNALKLSLDQEISIYRKLITGEEVRISDIDTSMVTSRSRSSSRSSRSSSSSSSDSSRSPSGERKSSAGGKKAVVEAMLKTDTKLNASQKPQTPAKGKGGKTNDDVISVSWKVKGGTIRTKNPFDADEDAEALQKAMKGLGRDEDKIIAILSARTKTQRRQISTRFMVTYKKDLLKELESELSGNFLTTVQHLMWKKSVLDAQAIRKAIKGFGTDESVLIEILCTQSSREINEIKKDYLELFKRDMVADIQKETSSGFKDFLLAILKGRRVADSGTVVAEEAETDAKQLFAIQIKNWHPSNPTFLKIFTERSYQHLWYLFKQCWTKLSSDNLIDSIDKQCKGELKRGFKTIIRFSTLIPPQYYATQARDALTAKGVEDKQLIYIVTTRSEVDLIDIKEEYFKMNKKTLVKQIEEVTSGKYKKMLTSIIN